MPEIGLINQLANVNYDKLSPKLIKARTNIGILKGACYGLPNPQLLLSPTLMREALESSEIENIVTTLTAALQAQLFDEKERPPADKEVNRYNEALKAGEEYMKQSYLGTNAIIKIHDVLVPNEKGIRKSQNVLINSTTGAIVYQPISTELIPEYLSDLEKFINRQDSLDPVIKTIIIHYQFEKIHPFGDGNGRTGRILLVLCLIYFGLLDLPVLFISQYINNHKPEYYRVFNEPPSPQGYLSFVDYMLEAFIHQAKQSTDTLLHIKGLHEETKRQIREKLPKIYSRDLIDAIFSQPLMTATRYSEIMKISYPTAHNHLRKLEQAGFMKSANVGKYRIYANIKLMRFLNNQN